MVGDQPLPGLKPGFVIWFVGLPASGKTSVARAVQSQLAEQGTHSVLLDSDDLRAVLTPTPTYDASERDWFYGVLGYLATWLAASGVNVLLAATAHRRVYRQAARSRSTRFAEVFVQCSLETCRRRDPKGIYACADQGLTPNVPGLGSEFEPPEHPEATISTETGTPADGAAAVLTQLAQFIAAQ